MEKTPTAGSVLQKRPLHCSLLNSWGNFHLINTWCYHLIKNARISLDQHSLRVYHLINSLISAGISLDQHSSRVYHLINSPISARVSLDQHSMRVYHLINSLISAGISFDQQNCFPQYHLVNKKVLE